MPYSPFKWTGDEPGVANIVAASTKLADKQSRLWAQEDLKKAKDEAKCSQATMQSNIEDLHKQLDDNTAWAEKLEVEVDRKSVV